MTITINKQTAQILPSVLRAVITRWLNVDDPKNPVLNFEQMKKDKVTKSKVEGLIFLHESLIKKNKDFTKSKNK
jgi:hypothetical protein